MNNQEARVEAPIAITEGRLIGSNLMDSFKDQLLKQKVFREMFGDGGERIFYKKMPNVNESIVPMLVMRWATDKFKSVDTYFEGTIDCAIGLPTRVDGDVNALRQVANLFQRFIGGPMQMFDPKINPGLIKFGYDTEFKYGGMFKLDGVSLPAIEFTLNFVIDLQKLNIDDPSFDYFADLDTANLPWIESYSLSIVANNADKTILIPQGVFSETGKTN